MKRSQIDPRPLVALDQLIDAFASDATSDTVQLIVQTALEHLDRRALWATEGLDSLRSDELGPEERRFVVAVLLRMLAVDHLALRLDTPLGRAADPALDAVLSGDFYRKVGIEAGAQSFEKHQALSRIVPDAERNLKSAIEPQRLATLRSQRTEVMKAIVEARPILEGFVPRSLSRSSRISTLFDIVGDHLDAPPARAVTTLETAREELATLRDEASEVGTKYATQFFGALAETLQAIADGHFAGSAASKPATLQLEAIQKKYPLHQREVLLKVGFIIRNPGPGHALDVSVSLKDTDLNSSGHDQHLVGQLSSGSVVEVTFDARVPRPSPTALCDVEVRWQNADGSASSVSDIFELVPQQTDIDWDQWARADAYSLEPVETPEELIGRGHFLGQLHGTATLRSIGSTFVSGQRRVGKTSLVKTLITDLLDREPGIHTVFVEAGDFLGSDAASTIAALGDVLGRRVRGLSPALETLAVPEFEGTLVPLSRLLDDVLERAPSLRCLFILDEFDMIPPELYEARNPYANALFQAIRSVSGKRNFGFIIVGGENLRYLINGQGSALNKFDAIELTYLDEDRSDFTNLVRRPSSAYLEFTDEAVAAIWELTRGHPYFAKMVCREISREMVDRRDAHVTVPEVESAAQRLATETSANAFMHFWDDGISPFEQSDPVRILRKRILLAYAETRRGGAHASEDKIVDSVLARSPSIGKSAVLREIEDLIARRVLDQVDGEITCPVVLFEKWLQSAGPRKIIETLPERTSAEDAWLEEEKLLVDSQEISILVDKWGSYRGKQITSDDVRRWLQQFDGPRRQRAMFDLLPRIKFYSQHLIREKLNEAFGIVRRGLRTEITQARVRRDILVTYLGGAAKSGTSYARLFAQENRIALDNVVSTENVVGRGRQIDELRSIVIVDDFIGTGRSAATNLRELLTEVDSELAAPVHYVCLAGFASGMERIKKDLRQAGFEDGERYTITVCDILEDEDRAFADAGKSDYARAVAADYGRRLVKKYPLGFEDCQALVVFDATCPNNTLPVLWYGSNEWHPLFPRQ